MKTYSLTPTQMGIYLSETAAEGQGDYNINLVYYLDKEVDTERLVRALRQAVKRHPYIQSRLRQTEDGEIVLTDGSEEEVAVETATANSREEVLQRTGKAFDLLNDRLYRLVIYTLPNGTRMLNIDFHHIVCDGMSTRNFHEEVSQAYAGKYSERNSKLFNFKIIFFL